MLMVNAYLVSFIIQSEHSMAEVESSLKSSITDDGDVVLVNPTLYKVEEIPNLSTPIHLYSSFVPDPSQPRGGK